MKECVNVKVSVEELNCASDLLMMLMEFRNFDATGQARQTLRLVELPANAAGRLALKDERLETLLVGVVVVGPSINNKSSTHPTLRFL